MSEEVIVDLYERLEICRDATESEIKKAYRRLALKYHPDRNDKEDANEKFKALSEAYHILSDSEKRDTYDTYGFEGLKDVDDFAYDPSELFRRFFEGDFFIDTPTQNDSRIPVSATLEECYTGFTKTVNYDREILCGDCKGLGSSNPDFTPELCDTCHGEGFVASSDTEKEFCDDCHGQGERIPKDAVCPTCDGCKNFVDSGEVEVTFHKGAQDGDYRLYEGLGSEYDSEQGPGDLYCFLHEHPHEHFKRKNQNLLYVKKLSLVEALTGFEFTIPHLNGRTLSVKSAPGEIICPEDFRRIIGEGMPVPGEENNRGDLFIIFDVIFPEKGSLLQESIDVLKTILPPPIDDVLAVEDKCAKDYVNVTISEENVNIWDFDSEAEDCCGEEGCDCGDEGDDHDHHGHHDDHPGGVQPQCAQS